jgi:hypothetical protein
MPATIVARTDTAFTIQVEIPYASSMLDFEEVIQRRLNEAGVLATTEALQQFDADGSPIQIGDTKLTSKGKLTKEYQTPYGVAPVERHVYQSSRGGKTYCPLDREARIVISSTPKFAKMVSHKYAEFGSARVIKDLAENHGRVVARCFVQDVTDAVATVALARQEDWEYALPELEETPPTITIGMDGTCLLMCDDGWRETMVGTIGFYDAEGDRQHTIYLAATPEYGKATFLDRMEREIARVKAAYPGARYVGLADGAKGNWEFLGRHTETQVIDFWHAAEYLKGCTKSQISPIIQHESPAIRDETQALPLRPDSHPVETAQAPAARGQARRPSPLGRPEGGPQRHLLHLPRRLCLADDAQGPARLEHLLRLLLEVAQSRHLVEDQRRPAHSGPPPEQAAEESQHGHHRQSKRQDH